MMGSICSLYNADSVVLAAAITAIVCLAITVFAFQTKFDVTGMGMYLFVALFVFMLVGIFAMIFGGRFGTFNVIYAGIGALLFSMYLVFDTQLLIGGYHKYSISPEEYIFAALNIYLDIINIFIFILSIVGGRRD
jgi:FtsH-binding integral membrane protein